MTETRKALRRLAIALGIVAVLLAVLLVALSHRPPVARELPSRREAIVRVTEATRKRLEALIRRQAPAPTGRSALGLLGSITTSDLYLLNVGPFSANWLEGHGGGSQYLLLSDKGDLRVWENSFVSAERVRDGLATTLVAWESSRPRPPASGVGSPAFHTFLDALEAELDSRRTTARPTYFPWVVVRAFANGEPDRARALLRAFAEVGLEAHTRALVNGQPPDALAPLLTLLLDLQEQGLLTDEDLAPIAGALQLAELSDEEVKSSYGAAVLSWAEELKIPDPNAPMLGRLLQPLYARNVDSLAAAILANDGEIPARIRVELVNMLGGGRDQAAPFGNEPPRIREVHPGYRALMPWIGTEAANFNSPTYQAEFQVAAMRHRLRAGKWPASAEEIAPDLLPGDFSERTGCRWYVLGTDSMQYPLLASPPDAPSRLALDFLQSHRRHARSAEELRAWALEQNRPPATPPFATVPNRPMFLSIEPNGPAVEKADNGYVLPWEEPTAEDEQLIREAVAKSGGPEFGRCHFFLYDQDGRWAAALAALGAGS